MMGLAIDHVFVDLGMEGVAHLRHVAGEFDDLFAGLNFAHFESVRAQP